MTKRKQDLLETIFFPLPAIILVALMIYIPFVLSGYYSFTRWNGIAKDPEWVGLRNFINIFSGNTDFFKTLSFTFRYTVFFMIFTNIIALFLAMALVNKFRLANLLRGVFFIPYVMSMIIVGFLWQFIFTSGFDTLYKMTGWGLFNWSWLGTPKMAGISVIVVGIWQSLGFYMVLYIAGFESMPSDVLEAATVDGATGWIRMKNVILPLLAPSISTCMFMSLTNSLKLYDIVQSLTRGGPAGSTVTVTVGIYRDAFQSNRYGLGAAESLLFFIIILVLTQIVNRVFKPEV
ncbi:MAG: sugar ABC transporter permease [Spirochaetaceae bacterium]|jgi:raffinose/stachyose/melibiose transport system permease protein|nr:sugar ABC transporter permease [Spirochaetaceae bacterium]